MKMKTTMITAAFAAALCATAMVSPVSALTTVSSESEVDMDVLNEHGPYWVTAMTIPELKEYIGTEDFYEFLGDGHVGTVLTPDNFFMLKCSQYADKTVAYVNASIMEPIWFRIYTNTPMTEDDFPELQYLNPFSSAWYADVSFLNGEGYAKDYKYYYTIQVDREAFLKSKQIKDTGGFENPEVRAALVGWYYEAYSLLKDREDIATSGVTAYFQTAMGYTKTFSTSSGFGDINEDEQINVCDAILMSRIAAEEQGVPVTDKGKDNGDMNYDGVITAEDVMLLLKKLAKK